MGNACKACLLFLFVHRFSSQPIIELQKRGGILLKVQIQISNFQHPTSAIDRNLGAGGTCKPRNTQPFRKSQARRKTV